MSKTWLFDILVALAIAIIVVSIIGGSRGVLIVLSMLLLTVSIWLYLSVIRQLKTVQNGLYLLQAQDFASRLSKVGNHDADRIVDLFNGLMQALKEERLKKEEQDKFLQQLIEASPMGIAICNLDGDPVTTNRAYHNLLDDTLSREIVRLRPGESKTVRSHGSEVFRITRLWFMERGFQRPFILIERLTDEIIKVEKQTYGKVIRTLAHEANNTLGAITSVFETLMETERDGDVLRTLGACHTRCINMSDFISKYANVVKVPVPIFQPVNLKVEVERFMPFLNDIAADYANIRLEGEAERVNADAGLMQQVFINIVKNAVEAIQASDTPDGEIIVRFDKKALYFINNGPDITHEVAENLFSPFYTTKPDGQGIGLMLTADILRAHKADFSLASSGGQTAFTIKFP